MWYWCSCWCWENCNDGSTEVYAEDDDDDDDDEDDVNDVGDSEEDDNVLRELLHLRIEPLAEPVGEKVQNCPMEIKWYVIVILN